MSSLAEVDVSNLFAIAGRVRPVKPVEFALRLAGGENAGSISMHFAGTTWQLSSITLPPRVVAELVDRLPIH